MIHLALTKARRRAEGVPLLVKKFQANAETCFPYGRLNILALFDDMKRLEPIAMNGFTEFFATAANS